MRLVWVAIPLILIGVIGTIVLIETTKTSEPQITFSTDKEIYEVDAGDKGVFDVEYAINGGILKDITKDRDALALLISIEATNNGEITLNFPRELMEAKKSQDDTFIILINGIETAYQESVVLSEFREITINFEPGDLEIEIISPFYP